MFIVVVDYTPENRVSKFQDFNVEQDAIAFLAEVIGDFSNAFYTTSPIGEVSDWLVGDNDLSYSPDLTELISGLKLKIEKEMYNRIKQGVRWALNNGGTRYNIPITDNMEKFFLRNLAELNEGRTNPHKGYVYNGIERIFMDDAGLRELSRFSGAWGDEISRIRLDEIDSLASMDQTQLLNYNPGSIDWLIDWSTDPQNNGNGWNDDLCLQSP